MTEKIAISMRPVWHPRRDGAIERALGALNLPISQQTWAAAILGQVYDAAFLDALTDAAALAARSTQSNHGIASAIRQLAAVWAPADLPAKEDA